MKKILLATTASLMFTTASYAFVDGVYAKLNGGLLAKAMEVKLDDAENLLTMDRGPAALVEFGLGVKAADFVQSDFTVSMPIGVKAKRDAVKNEASKVTIPEQHLEPFFFTPMFNVSVDLVKIDGFRPYVRGGLGMSFMKATYGALNVSAEESSSGTVVAPVNGETDGYEMNFAWTVGGGVFVDLGDGFSLGAEVSYKDFGPHGVIKQGSDELLLQLGDAAEEKPITPLNFSGYFASVSAVVDLW